MFRDHTLRAALWRVWAVLCCAGLLQGCAREHLSDVDNALKLVLLKSVDRMPPEVPEEAVHCIAFLDTMRNPPPRVHKEWTREWKRLCESEKQGRVKDPEPWVIPSLRKEFLLKTPDMRPFSQCRSPSLMTRDEWERTRLVLVERLEQSDPDTIQVTLQIRNPCMWAEEGGEGWGYGTDCFVERDKEGQWKFNDKCALFVII